MGLLLLLFVPFLAACDEENPFQSVTPGVLTGTDQVWELALDGFPSAWDFRRGERFFLQGDRFLDSPQTFSTRGSWVLGSRSDGTLVFLAFEVLVPNRSSLIVGIIDLTEQSGVTDFDAVARVPGGGYSNARDSTGVPVVEGHVYAFRVAQLNAAGSPLNYAKVEVIDVDREIPDDPDSRFVRFRWAYQRQPLNRNVEVGE